jgi:membrane protease YdiL (CAAX protease family)
VTPQADAAAAGWQSVPSPEVPGWPQAPGVPAPPDMSGPAEGPWPRAPLAPDPGGRAWPQAPPAGGPAEEPRAESPAQPESWPESPAQPGPGGASGAPDAGPKLRAASPGDPFYLPRASWLWLITLIGLVVAAAPQALLAISALFSSSSSGGGGKAVTAGDAVVLAVFSLVLYGWEGFAVWLFSVRGAGRSFVLWGFRRPTKAYFWVVPLGLVAVYAFSIVHDIIVSPKQQAIVNDFPHSALGAGMFLLVAVVMAPVFEEIVFRGFLFRGFANSWGWVWGALASAAIFGAAHLQLDVFLPLAALGFVLAWAYKKTGSLWTCITMHALFNLIAVVAWIVSS